MHLGNGAITPECALVTWTAATAGLGWAAARLVRRPQATRPWYLAGAVGGVILAAQMVNLPLLPGTSGHLVGGVLAAALLGPELAILVLASVLAVQAAWFGDGGMMAWGANLLNMGILPAVLVSWTRHPSSADGGSTASRWAQAMRWGLLAAAAVPLAAGLLVAEVSLGRSGAELAGLSRFAALVLGAHLVIGLAESLLTVACLGLLARVGAVKSLRVATGDASCNSDAIASGVLLARTGGPRRSALVLLAVAGGLVYLWPWSSPLPDGYEMAAERSGMERLVQEEPRIVGAVSAWNLAVLEWQQRVVESFQGLAGDGL
ncbi:MAG: energy-coupling factor ABC transporter permease, partial [Pirellulaceae bacterium]|nr:energy-coupling factor ABC transporter permease [Pirellulaceae bacterium]